MSIKPIENHTKVQTVEPVPTKQPVPGGSATGTTGNIGPAVIVNLSNQASGKATDHDGDSH